MDDQKNVLQFPRKTAVFTPHLRKEITTRIKPRVKEEGDVDQIINSTEDAICHWLVVAARSLAKKAGESLGLKIGDKTDSVMSAMR